MKRFMLAWIGCAAVAGLVLGAWDAGRLALFEREMFFGAAELLAAMAWSTLACGGAGAVLGAVAAALAFSVRGLSRRRQAALLTVVLFPALSLFSWKLTAGPQASASVFRVWIVLAVAVLGTAASVGSVFFFSAWSRAHAHRQRLLVGAGAALAAAAVVVDSVMLVRLYPLFHLGLTVLAFFAIALPLRTLPWQALSARALRVLVVVVLCTVGLGAWSMWALRSSQNPRYVVGDRTASAAEVLNLMTRLVPLPTRRSLNPPAPLARAAAPSPGPMAQLPVLPGESLFLITIDAMRADRLRPGSDGRHPMPNLERLARRSTVFTRAYTPYPHTSYSVSSLLTGKYTHALFEVPGAPKVHETWPQILSRFRYKTAGFFTKAIFFIDKARFAPYAETSYGFSYRKADYLVPAKERVAQVQRFLDEVRVESPHSPLFVWTHFFEAHEPYEPTCQKYGDAPVDRYDCELATVDDALGVLLERLERDYPKALLIVTADHGEEFGDHGGQHHGTTLYDEQARVPLLIRVPGLPHRVVDAPVSLVDLLGTSLALLDVPLPARVRSRDLRPLLVGADPGETHEAFAEVGDEAMLVASSHKLVCDGRTQLCRLYDLIADPREERSVAQAKPDLVQDLTRRLDAMRRSHAEVELRPVASDQGQVGWPDSLRRAMAGDKSACESLPAIVSRATSPALLRRKAAELLWSLCQGRFDRAAFELTSEPDHEVAAWLWLARVEAGDEGASASLFELIGVLDSASLARHQAVLSLMRAGHEGGPVLVVALVRDPDVSIELRAAGLALLSDKRHARFTRELLPLVDEYQLTLAAAQMLKAMGSTLAVPTLLARLARERFPERKAVLVRALAEIGDRRATPVVAEQLFESVPAPDLLLGLGRLASSPVKGRTFQVRGKGSALFVTKPDLGGARRAPGPGPLRVVVRARTTDKEGVLSVECGGAPGTIPLTPVLAESVVDLVCGAEAKRPTVRFSTLPDGLSVEVEALALVSFPQ